MTALQRPESAARALTKLPADLALVPLRHDREGTGDTFRAVGEAGTPSPLAGGAGDGVPVSGQNVTNRDTKEVAGR
jgi:hypothetical protein